MLLRAIQMRAVVGARVGVRWLKQEERTGKISRCLHERWEVGGRTWFGCGLCTDLPIVGWSCVCTDT